MYENYTLNNNEDKQKFNSVLEVVIDTLTQRGILYNIFEIKLSYLCYLLEAS